MVLSLVDISLRSITKGIQDGTIQYPHLLPPILRERVLDTAIKQGLASHPNVLALLTSVEFLNGMTSLTIDARTKYDLIFLKRLQESMATELPNGDTVGAHITKLNLKVGGWYFGSDGWRLYFYAASDLIHQCPNTTSLDFRVMEPFTTKGSWPLKNLNSFCRRAMENLVELSLCNLDWHINLEHLIVNFRQLTTLKLNNCFIKGDLWPEVFKNIQSVENLQLFNVYIGSKEGLDSILPYPLPHLKLFEVLRDYDSFFKCNKAFVDNLVKCPELRQVHLKLDQMSTDEESLVRLAKMDIALKMKFHYFVREYIPAETAAVAFDSSSRFKVVTIFRDRMDSFELYGWDKREQYLTALEDVLNTCSNLTTIGLRLPSIRVKRINAALVRFFGDLERAQLINRLILYGDFDETVLSTIFKSCVNVHCLEIHTCSTLRDQHLIDWVSLGGGNLTDLVVDNCNNVTSEGIIPILAKSAEGLLHCKCYNLRQDNGGRNWKTVFNNQCPNVIHG